MRIYVTRGQSSARIPFRLPAAPAEIEEIYSKLEALGCGGRTSLKGIVSSVSKLNHYLLNTDLDSSGGIEKLNRLAEMVDAMDEAEASLFAGALDAESVNGMDDVLRVADSLDDYTIIKEVHSDRELGGYLVERGYLQCPEELRRYLDYAAVGAEFYSDHGGAYSPEGYVIHRSELPLCLKKAHASEKCEEIIFLKLEKGSQRYTLVLPADDKYLDDIRRYLGTEDLAEAKIVEASYSIPYLSDLLSWDCVSVEDANELALAVEEMQETDGELLKFCSVLEVEQPQTFRAALELAMNIDDYEMVPRDPEGYGEEILRYIGGDDEVIETIDGYMDFKCFGEDMMAEDGVRRTEFGMVRRLSEPFPPVPEQGPQMGGIAQ